MLLVSWRENHSDIISTFITTLYHIEMGSYNTFSMDSTTRNHYRFTALEPCSHYVICVETADTHSLTCLSTITGMDRMNICKSYCLNKNIDISISMHTGLVLFVQV